MPIYIIYIRINSAKLLKMCDIYPFPTHFFALLVTAVNFFSEFVGILHDLVVHPCPTAPSAISTIYLMLFKIISCKVIVHHNF